MAKFMAKFINRQKFINRPALAAVVLGGAVLAPLGFAEAQNASDMSFFITSVGVGNGANLGGLAGADAHCQALATAAGAGGKTWQAYLSVQAGGDVAAVNARDRIGTGPWVNAKGIEIAAGLDALHAETNAINKDTALNEMGAIVNGRGDTPNQHDILTGSQRDGTAFANTDNMTCGNWTSNGEGTAMMGHHDLTGNPAGVNYWNFSHGSRGCSQENLVSTGGAGLFYCFATN